MFINSEITYKSVLLEISVLLLLVLVLKEVGIITAFIYFILQIFLMRNDEWLLKSLFYFFLFRFLNPLLLPNSTTLMILSWLILLIVFSRLMFISNLKEYKGLKPFFAFIFIAFIASLFKSDYLGISLFKLLSFSMGFLSVFLALNKTQNYPWEEFFILVWLFILVVSLPTLLFPQIGFARNATGFQGITNHPQFFGPFCALMGGVGTVLFSLKKIKRFNSILFFTFLILNFAVVFLSESRTALLLFSFLCLIGLVIYLKETRLSISKIFPKTIIISASLILIGLFNYSILEDKVINFLAKDRTETTTNLTFDRFAKSRSRLTDVSLKNFEENPLLGIGFAAPNHYYDFEIEYLKGTSIPISASMEKGVLLALLLEEVGIIGFLVFGVFILSFFVPVYRKNKVYLVFIIGPLILNLGEATFFSANGQGILLWSLFSLAFIRSTFLLNNQKNENLRLAA